MSLIDRLRQHEGLRLQVYDDATGKAIQPGSQVVGNPTIGIGTLLSAPGGITAAEANVLLINRVNQATSAAMSIVPGLSGADPVRFDVVVEMVFQLGAGGVQKFANTIAAINAQQWDTAASGMLDSLWARQTPVRANELATIMRTGQAQN